MSQAAAPAVSKARRQVTVHRAASSARGQLAGFRPISKSTPAYQDVFVERVSSFLPFNASYAPARVYASEAAKGNEISSAN